MRSWMMLSCLLALAACSAHVDETAAIDESDDSNEAVTTGPYKLAKKDNGRTVTVAEGRKIVVSLSSNPSTGYGWEVLTTDRSFGYPSETYVASSSHAVGAPGTTKLTWETSGLAGTHTVKLGYVRGASAPVETFTFTVKVKGVTKPAGASVGETCGDGVFGRPNIECATGLSCKYPQGGPAGPSGSSSARAGTCVSGALVGETCGDGVFGRPNIACATGLSCKYPQGGPTGPSGSSSARAGTCSGALSGESCGDGVFGRPLIDCAQGLVCTYPTGPVGPAGASSSAAIGTCR